MGMAENHLPKVQEEVQNGLDKNSIIKTIKYTNFVSNAVYSREILPKNSDAFCILD
jgi:hypothetical protein